MKTFASTALIRRRLPRALVTAAIALLGIALVVPPASAMTEYKARNNTSVSNTCLTISKRRDGQYLVRVGIDLRKFTRAQAQKIIDSGGGPGAAEVWGADEVTGDDHLFDVSRTRIWASDQSGLSAEFAGVVRKNALDEDSEPFPTTDGARDEIFAIVTFRGSGYITPDVYLYAN
ncbi:hypothetical protein AAH991_37225 [Microbispora sp. ZYX-F-249]|uniref:Uncharacterized protein n=1 Tax=Microbispora maris TaxID=3144104 RepID=A0ABV0AZW8_9ACTN